MISRLKCCWTGPHGEFDLDTEVIGSRFSPVPNGLTCGENGVLTKDAEAEVKATSEDTQDEKVSTQRVNTQRVRTQKVKSQKVIFTKRVKTQTVSTQRVRIPGKFSNGKAKATSRIV